MTADEMSRRAVLKVLAGSAGAAMAIPCLSGALASYQPRHFTPAQMNTLEALTEAIIPTDEHSPGARAAGVPAYIDTIVGAAEGELKQLYAQGLEALDRLAQEANQKELAACTQPEQVAILQKLSANEGHPLTLEDRFFIALKRATVDGYYTSSIGIHQDLEYQGNRMVHNFTGCIHTEHQTLKSGQ